MSNINDIPTFEVPKPDPEQMRAPKITMKTRRRLERKYGIEVNRRLPRRLKKAARHVDFDMMIKMGRGEDALKAMLDAKMKGKG